MVMQVKMIVDQKLKMLLMIRYLETKWVYFIGLAPMEPVVSTFMTLNVKCPIFYATDDEDVESHLLHNNNWITSLGIAEEAISGRFLLTPGGDACFCYEAITHVGNCWNNLQLFCIQFSKLGQIQKKCFKGGDHFSLMRPLTQLTPSSKVETVCLNAMVS